MDFVEKRQGSLLPFFLQIWSLKFFKKFSNVTPIVPAPTGPTDSSLM